MKNRKQFLHLLLLGAFTLAGCASSPESRIKDDPAGYSGLPPDQQKLVSGGQLALGMSEKAVELAVGKPGKITESTDSNRSLRIWHYQNYQSSQSIGYAGFWGGPRYGFFPEIIVSTPQPTGDRIRVVFDKGHVVSIEREVE